MSEGKELKIISEEVAVNDFSPEELERVKEIAKSIDIKDSQAIIEYGVGAQSDIADFSEWRNAFKFYHLGSARGRRCPCGATCLASRPSSYLE